MSDPIANYFAQYPTFNFRPSADWRQKDAFNALAQQEQWTQSHRATQWEQFKSLWAQVAEIEFSGNALSHYQTLCEDLDIYPVPESITTCRSALTSVFVNIVDLVQYRKDRRAGRWSPKATRFRNLHDLKKYSMDEKKWYPKETAKAEMLRDLLKILD
jgi:hypothetical protein